MAGQARGCAPNSAGQSNRLMNRTNPHVLRGGIVVRRTSAHATPITTSGGAKRRGRGSANPGSLFGTSGSKQLAAGSISATFRGDPTTAGRGSGTAPKSRGQCGGRIRRRSMLSPVLNEQCQFSGRRKEISMIGIKERLILEPLHHPSHSIPPVAVLSAVNCP